ncbi:hypothetical protein COO91_00692 [Nostoc flagelliforme CCNUN1]|uniref:Uncharacterized protein n=1 Tax=Nostoc flagelliforme CCNUN1 TaxID=2038116 RepID=A0A2K8SHB0_9NOSO|nr:hypothetical protein COO91_00692 [Nostoc flagelliforme CCNUN1]
MGIGHEDKGKNLLQVLTQITLSPLPPLLPLLPLLPHPPLPTPHICINKTNISKEVSNYGDGKVAKLKQNNIRNLT